MGRVPTRMATMEQLAFDFDEFAREDARARLPEWAGAPLHYTEDYYPPRLLDEAFEHWRFINGSFGSFARIIGGKRVYDEKFIRKPGKAIDTTFDVQGLIVRKY